jgi:hypothetical protein
MSRIFGLESLQADKALIHKWSVEAARFSLEL